jgi:hypothetical protein
MSERAARRESMLHVKIDFNPNFMASYPFWKSPVLTAALSETPEFTKTLATYQT